MGFANAVLLKCAPILSIILTGLSLMSFSCWYAVPSYLSSNLPFITSPDNTASLSCILRCLILPFKNILFTLWYVFCCISTASHTSVEPRSKKTFWRVLTISVLPSVLFFSFADLNHLSDFSLLS